MHLPVFSGKGCQVGYLVAILDIPKPSQNVVRNMVSCCFKVIRADLLLGLFFREMEYFVFLRPGNPKA